MGTRSTILVLVVGVPIALLLLGGAARAESVDPESDNSLRQKQESALEAEVEGLDDVAAQLKEAQDSISAAEARTREFEEQTRSLTEQADLQRLKAAKAQVRLGERAKAAYKGEDIVGASAVVDSVFGDDGPDLDAIVEGPLGRMLAEDRQIVKAHKDSERALKETLRSLTGRERRKRSPGKRRRPGPRNSSGARAS